MEEEGGREGEGNPLPLLFVVWLLDLAAVFRRSVLVAAHRHRRQQIREGGRRVPFSPCRFCFSSSLGLRPPLLPIRFAVFLVHLATIPITRTGINLARSLGAAIIFNRDHAWNDQWIFGVGPFIGVAHTAMYHQVKALIHHHHFICLLLSLNV
ncbi:hypothetical protein HN51_034276 [Arachis hypogaea]